MSKVSDTESASSANGSVNASKNALDKTEETESEDTDDELEDEGPIVPPVPDGGWGWMCVLGSFMIHVICDGIAHSFGVFVPHFVEYFQSSKSVVGGLGSLMIGVTWGSGNIDLFMS